MHRLVGFKTIHNNSLLKNVVGRNCIINLISKRQFNNTSSELLLEERFGNVCVLKMAKGPVNTFDIDMMKLFQNKIVELENDPEIEGVVLTSAYDGIFSAGLDLYVIIYFLSM